VAAFGSHSTIIEWPKKQQRICSLSFPKTDARIEPNVAGLPLLGKQSQQQQHRPSHSASAVVLFRSEIYFSKLSSSSSNKQQHPCHLMLFSNGTEWIPSAACSLKYFSSIVLGSQRCLRMILMNTICSIAAEFSSSIGLVRIFASSVWSDPPGIVSIYSTLRRRR